MHLPVLHDAVYEAAPPAGRRIDQHRHPWSLARRSSHRAPRVPTVVAPARVHTALSRARVLEHYTALTRFLSFYTHSR